MGANAECVRAAKPFTALQNRLVGFGGVIVNLRAPSSDSGPVSHLASVSQRQNNG